MDEDLLISFLGELKREAEYTAQQIAFTVNSEGKTIYYVLTRAVGDNGTAKEIMRIVAPNATGTAYVATNMALLSMEVPTALAFIGPALGITVGAGVLSQTEPFQNLGTKIGESLYAFINDDGIVYFPEETVQAYAEQMYLLNWFEEDHIYDPDFYEEISNAVPSFAENVGISQPLGSSEVKFYTGSAYARMTGPNILFFRLGNGSIIPKAFSLNSGRLVTEYYADSSYTTPTATYANDLALGSYTIGGRTYTFYASTNAVSSVDYVILDGALANSEPYNNIDAIIVYILFGAEIINEYIQPEATIPTILPIDFPTVYPDWIPDTIYPELPEEETLYPIAIPGTIPDIPTPQPEIQTPDPLVDPSTDPRTDQISQLIDDLVIPTPTPIPTPVPTPTPDPDPSPTVDPDPPLDPTQPVEPNPPSANVDPDPSSPTIVDPALVSAAGKLFTVYNPGSSAIDALGAYLWSTNVIDIIKTIWQNPMDAVISYFILYATPEANATSNIYLGSLDSGVSSPVVTNQFIDIDCGEVQIKEKWNNVGDYPPYTTIKLFLPFVGFVDINPDDVMGKDDGGGFIKVTYRVDVYTGTCLAQVWVKRAADMSNYQILYTYNGNCAQQMPLTGATYQGLMQTLVGASVGFATAGLTGALASGATQFAGHQQVQMQRSGNMSANAGVLGQRKPYLIISRNNVYYATNFAEYYGYPAHATVVLGNMSGYVRVRDIHLEIPATSEEIDEVEALLKEGVWF